MADDLKAPLESAFASNSRNRPPPKEQWERDADAFEQCGLDGVKYIMDERQIHLFEGLHFCEERREWLARFRPAFKEHYDPNNPYTMVHDLPYQKVLRGAQRMSDAGIKPTQSYRALKTFGARLDQEAAKLDFFTSFDDLNRQP